MWHSSITKFSGDGVKLTSVDVRQKQEGEESTFATTTVSTDGAFVAIGHQPNTAMLTGVNDQLGKKCSNDAPQIATDPEGYIRTSAGSHTATSVHGVFAAGDVAVIGACTVFDLEQRCANIEM